MLEEVCEALKIESCDNVVVIETVRKIAKVIHAVPRMEGFISNISKLMLMLDDPHESLPLE